MIIFIFLNFVFAADPITVRENNQIANLIEKERTLEAHDKLQRAVVNRPKQPEYHYNLGLTYHKNEDFQKAQQGYSKALQLTEDPELKFHAHFNQAKIYEEQKQIPEAVGAYQAALEFRPDSIEAKHNLELLLRKQAGGGNGQNNQQQNQSGQGDDQNQAQNENQKENKEEQKPQDQPKGQQQYPTRPKPQEFKSQNLSKQDVQKIFEELERQEDKIRGKILEKKSKGSNVGKDW